MNTITIKDPNGNIVCSVENMNPVKSNTFPFDHLLNNLSDKSLENFLSVESVKIDEVYRSYKMYENAVEVMSKEAASVDSSSIDNKKENKFKQLFASIKTFFKNLAEKIKKWWTDTFKRQEELQNNVKVVSKDKESVVVELSDPNVIKSTEGLFNFGKKKDTKIVLTPSDMIIAMKRSPSGKTFKIDKFNDIDDVIGGIAEGIFSVSARDYAKLCDKIDSYIDTVNDLFVSVDSLSEDELTKYGTLWVTNFLQGESLYLFKSFNTLFNRMYRFLENVELDIEDAKGNVDNLKKMQSKLSDLTDTLSSFIKEFQRMEVASLKVAYENNERVYAYSKDFAAMVTKSSKNTQFAGTSKYWVKTGLVYIDDSNKQTVKDIKRRIALFNDNNPSYPIPIVSDPTEFTVLKTAQTLFNGYKNMTVKERQSIKVSVGKNKRTPDEIFMDAVKIFIKYTPGLGLFRNNPNFEIHASEEAGIFIKPWKGTGVKEIDDKYADSIMMVEMSGWFIFEDKEEMNVDSSKLFHVIEGKAAEKPLNVLNGFNHSSDNYNAYSTKRVYFNVGKPIFRNGDELNTLLKDLPKIKSGEYSLKSRYYIRVYQPVDNSYTKYRDPLLHTAVYIEDKGTGVKVKEVTQDYPELVEWNEYMDSLRL